MSYIGKTPTSVPLTSSDITDGIITTTKIADDAATADKIANAVNSAISANTSKTTNATHSGEVTGATALTIADNIVDEANLKVSNAPVNGYMLTAQSGNTGGMTWAEAGGGAWNLLSTTLADNSGRVDCTLSGSYDNYAIILDGIHPASDNVGFRARMSTASITSDGGNNYRYISATSQDSGSTNTYQGQGDVFIKVAGDNMGNASGESLEATIFIGNPAWTEHSTRLNILSAHTDDAGRATTSNTCGVYNPTTAVTQINFLMTSGNIQYGVFKVYGIS